MGQAVGIDLGTTFSAIAILDEEREAQAILNAEGKLTTPSVAIWQDGAYVVGQPALNMVERADGTEREHLAAALIRGVKRMVGNPPIGGLISNGHRKKLAMSDDHSEKVIKIMCGGSGELPESFHFLRVAQLLFQCLPGGHILDDNLQNVAILFP